MRKLYTSDFCGNFVARIYNIYIPHALTDTKYLTNTKSQKYVKNTYLMSLKSTIRMLSESTA